MVNTIDKVLYTGHTHTSGGRDGTGKSSDGALDVRLSTPGSGKPGTNYWPYLKLCDQRLYEQGGRPHWGKLHFMTEERLTARFPKFDAFKALRRAFDPAGMFLNDHLAPMFG